MNNTLESKSEKKNLPPNPSLRGVRFFTDNFKKNKIPFLVLDHKLKILWNNRAFLSLFHQKKTLLGESLSAVFFKHRNSNSINKIYNSISSDKFDFSWQGKVEFRSRDFLNIVADLMIFPIKNPDLTKRKPMCFAAIFHDVSKENRSILKKTFLSLLEASKLKDNDTGQHILRVNKYSMLISKYLYNKPGYPEINAEFISNISFLAAMHDVGKIGTPDGILNKKGPLNDSEWEIMKEHTINGGFILSSYPSPMAKEIALYHHERWDGTGYPYYLSGKLIPLAARIVSIADTYDALRMERSYKESFSHEKACSIMESESRGHFDPDLLYAFKKIKSKFSETFSSMNDN